ncbi:U2 small nuclear ribonucleoprotein auxiliary factor 35 kDa subunit-related protein 2 isoform X2 [Thalassophryne amazonica]|uniref:U2 small nuclear ribonucleoprotein auxiliary factor 35 kDa subunit-related protein 2 isoform X2 n=1 Tax=Thalassophryne amazonica TaxID=390379 RepID=UPI0014714178|nr:U2 small nuclear ribonucleoprotein auxiliary factor 35 kDa subunit-related protein 2 isoform X2 [Thalassophryne amazonica]
MATSALPLVSAPPSQKQRKALLRKERRKRKRQALAQAKEWGQQHEVGLIAEEAGDVNEEDDHTAEVERQWLHEEWLERERLAQEEFKLKSEREEAARKRKEEEERRIKEEWEAQQRREQEEKEQKQLEKQHREEAVQKMLDEAENQLENRGLWMNPEAPVIENSENYGTEHDVANCSFFLKTGACRFGDRCSRKHIYPTSSHTLMIRGMFTTFGMEESCRDDYDIDACLEHSEEELQEYFLEFYHDVLPEFRSVGRVVQFKVSCNFEPHLRGNVYVQFATEEKCKEAFIKFNGRWYAGKQLHCELCPITRWKNAICGLFDRQKCPKGKHCNFLHVFRNPGNEFWEADRDLNISPDQRGNHRDGRYSERYRDRSWRQHFYNRSPPRSERSHRKGRSRERSRERRNSLHRQEDKWSSRSRHSSSRKDEHRSSSRDRSRSRSKDRERRRYRREDRSHRCRSRSRERDGDRKHRDSRREERDISRSSSREQDQTEKSSKNSSVSPYKNKKNSDDGNATRHRHKHSKKSKKRRKKHKKKSHLTEEVSSSGESEDDKNSEEDTVESLSGTSPRQQADVELHPAVDVGKMSSADQEEKPV